MDNEKNPYDPIKEPASYQFWNDKQEKAPLCPTCKCINPIICSNGWHKVNECTPLSEQKQEGETVQSNALSAVMYFRSQAKYQGNGDQQYAGTVDGVIDLMVGFASQNTAKQIEENAYGWISKLNEKQIQIQGKDKQIDQYKARIVELEQMLQLATSHINNPKPNI